MNAIRTVVLLATLAAPAASQEKPIAKPQAPEQTISIEFRGGSLADYVAAVRAAGDSVNILLSPLASEVHLPSLVLKNVAVESALDAVTDIVRSDLGINVRRHRGNTGSPVYSVGVRQRPRQPSQTTQGSSSRVVEVFSMSTLTDELADVPKGPGLTVKPETILSAIETGLGISQEKEKAVIRFHADSGLLFVQGSRAQQDIVRGVLSRMRADVLLRRASAVQATGVRRSGSAGDPQSPVEEKRAR